MSVMPGQEKILWDLSWVQFSDQHDLSCDASDCSCEAVVRTFWETPPECGHDIRNYCILHRDMCLEDYEEICKGTDYDRWVCSVCQETRGVDARVYFLGMEPIR